MFFFPGIFVNTIFIPLNPFGSINSFCTHCPYLSYEKCSQTWLKFIFFFSLLFSLKTFSDFGFEDVFSHRPGLLKATHSSAQDMFSAFCTSVPLCCTHGPLSLSLKAFKVFTLTLALGIVVKQPQASGLSKGFRSPWLSLLHLPPASNALLQMTAAGPATLGLGCCRMFQLEPNPNCQAHCKWRLQEVW